MTSMELGARKPAVLVSTHPGPGSGVCPDVGIEHNPSSIGHLTMREVTTISVTPAADGVPIVWAPHTGRKEECQGIGSL
ncbi:MAG: hypothetical protein J07HQW1_02911 [Haloquadratum walsbyi J07HQW1]|uniref:Uncharacterized protein n=1 Tax=Haloquadratum walsbyi J07HQW1 TaxID=1238424 RepID=U1PGX7_9EURY|nr:MAG: hypothetical protein J07HQW1_02911 [Haloquadratum walsbyi J07HQW1]